MFNMFHKTEVTAGDTLFGCWRRFTVLQCVIVHCLRDIWLEGFSLGSDVSPCWVCFFAEAAQVSEVSKLLVKAYKCLFLLTTDV